MKTVPDKFVEKTWKRVTEASPEDAQAMLDQMACSPTSWPSMKR
jgi:hypothetical protein